MKDCFYIKLIYDILFIRYIMDNGKEGYVFLDIDKIELFNNYFIFIIFLDDSNYDFLIIGGCRFNNFFLEIRI